MEFDPSESGLPDFSQIVWPSYYIDGKSIYGDFARWQESGSSIQYYAMNQPHLPFELAKIQDGDEASALEFVSNWGFLGYSTKGQRYEDWFDPLWFVWGHAWTTRTILNLWEAVRSRSEDAITAAIDGLRGHVTDYGYRSKPPEKWVNDFYEDRPDDIGRIFFANEWDTKEVHFVTGKDLDMQSFRFDNDGFSKTDKMRDILWMIAELLNGNLEGVYQTMSVGKWPSTGEDIQPGQPLFSFTTVITNLFQAAYYHIAILITQNQMLARCSECGHLFNQTDARQRFCPPSADQIDYARARGLPRPQSRCGSKFRVRKLRSHMRES